MNILYVVIAVVVVAGLWVMLSYNKLIRMVNRAKEAWSDIDVQLKRRYDLIPNLVNTVKGYATHESQVFENVTKARAQAISAGTVAEQGQAENMLSDALKSLFAVSEAYPDLKANTNFLELQRELSDTENKIQSARRFYNTNVRDLNTAVQVFPANIIANMFGFKEMEFFEIEEAVERENVEVKF
ncbi:MAG: LemA family protein [Candidatus Paceibacterota bacterium]